MHSHFMFLIESDPGYRLAVSDMAQKKSSEESANPLESLKEEPGHKDAHTSKE